MPLAFLHFFFYFFIFIFFIIKFSCMYEKYLNRIKIDFFSSHFKWNRNFSLTNQQKKKTAAFLGLTGFYLLRDISFYWASKWYCVHIRFLSSSKKGHQEVRERKCSGNLRRKTSRKKITKFVLFTCTLKISCCCCQRNWK